MGKNMARIDENNIVINIEWVSKETNESDVLKEIYECPVHINDTYVNGKFYRNNNLVLSPIEEAYKKIEELETQQEELNISYQEGINSI